jgi:hypothetical protein
VISITLSPYEICSCVVALLPSSFRLTFSIFEGGIDISNIMHVSLHFARLDNLL